MIDLIPPEHRTSTVAAILRGIEESGDWSLFPLLRDALADAGGVPPVDLLYARVLAMPEHDEARLDWADVVGGDRGEFVKIQCELAKLGHCQDSRREGMFRGRPLVEVCGHCDYCELLRQERELLPGRLGVILLNEPRDQRNAAAGHIDAEFARGFIDSITLDWQTFIRHHETLIWVPTQTVTCWAHSGNEHSRNAKSGKGCTGRIRRPFTTTVACPECMETGISGTMGRKREPVDCENCGATGRITVSLARIGSADPHRPNQRRHRRHIDRRDSVHAGRVCLRPREVSDVRQHRRRANGWRLAETLPNLPRNPAEPLAMRGVAGAGVRDASKLVVPFPSRPDL